GRSAPTPSEQAVAIAHDRVPGRVRLRVPELKRRPGLGPLLQQGLLALAGVSGVTVNPITGSLLIQFEPAQASSESLLVWMTRRLRRAIPADAAQRAANG